MNTAARRRYLDPTPLGVLSGLALPAPTLERDLIERLLLQGPQTALDVGELAVALGLEADTVARAMFALNRQHWVAVRVEAAAAPECCGLQQGLMLDLERLAADAAGVVLACSSGLALGAGRCDGDEAAAVAAGLHAGYATLATLHFALERITVRAQPGVDAGHPAWVSLGRRLLHACGGLSAAQRRRPC